MKQLSKPTNDYCIVVKLLIRHKEKGLSMKEAGNVMFFKFQTRLGELERSKGKDGEQRKKKLKIRRLPMNHTKPWGEKTKYTNYKSLASLSYLYNLYEVLCKKGLKK